jgi:hypothetical protein
MFNVLTSVVVWALWKLRNVMCFQGKRWSGVERILWEVAMLIRKWKLVNRPEEVEILEAWAMKLEQKSARYPRLEWLQVSGSSDVDDRSVLRNGLDAISVNVMPENVGCVTLNDSDVRLDVQRRDNELVNANMLVVSE